MPITKVGMATPASEKVITAWLPMLWRRSAVSTPSGMPMLSARNAATSTSSSVAGMRSTITSETGRQPIALAEVALDGVAQEAGELDGDGILEPELAAHLGAFGGCGLLAHHVVHRVAHEVEQHEAQEGDRQHDRRRLQQA